MIDETDRKILRLLQKDASLTASDIGEMIGLSQSPVWRRISKMEADGYVVGKRVVLNKSLLGFSTIVFVRIKISEHGRNSLDEFAKKASEIDEVQVVQLLLGEIDFRLKVVVRDLDHYHEILSGKILKLPGVSEVQSNVLLHEYKNTTSLPL